MTLAPGRSVPTRRPAPEPCERDGRPSGLGAGRRATPGAPWDPPSAPARRTRSPAGLPGRRRRNWAVVGIRIAARSPWMVAQPCRHGGRRSRGRRTYVSSSSRGAPSSRDAAVHGRPAAGRASRTETPNSRDGAPPAETEPANRRGRSSPSSRSYASDGCPRPTPARPAGPSPSRRCSWRVGCSWRSAGWSGSSGRRRRLRRPRSPRRRRRRRRPSSRRRTLSGRRPHRGRDRPASDPGVRRTGNLRPIGVHRRDAYTDARFPERRPRRP